MAHSSDWWPRSGRHDQLKLCHSWITYLSEDVKGPNGTTSKRYEAFGISNDEFSGFMESFSRAQAALERASDEETRTKAATAECNAAFDDLEFRARDMKRFHFHATRLPPGALAALDLREPAWGMGPLGDITAEIQAVPSLNGVGYGQIRFDIVVVSGDVKARNNRGHFHTRYGVFGPNDPPPRSYKDLPEDIISDRIKEFIKLDQEDSGKMIYFCSRIEQGDRKGSWGPITSARVP